MDEQVETDKPGGAVSHTAHTGQVSRRDFLKRASKDAVETGVSLVPGAAVAKVVLGTTEKDGTHKPSLAERWAAWRNNRLNQNDEEPKP